MKKYIVYCYLIFIIILLTGCPGAIDSLARKHLGHDYIYHEPSGLPIIEKEHSDKGIPGWIIDYDYNDYFIIALEKDVQLPEDKREKLIVSGDYNEYLLQNGYSKYWIIVHENDSIYGPFNKVDFLQKRKDLGVSIELKFLTEKK